MYEPWYKRFDWPLAAAAGLLVLIGLAMLLSSALGTDQPYARNQLVFCLVSLVAGGTLLTLGYRWLLQWAPVWYAIILLLLTVLAVFGRITRGAASWLSVGPFTLQPSELAKLVLIVMLVWLVERALTNHWSMWRLFGLMSVVAAPLIGLVVIQPDLGTAAVLATAWLICLWLTPVNKRILLLLLSVVIVISLVGWLTLHSYQRARITTFLNPGASPLGAGYNVLQSQIAVGSGGWFGQGWGRGTQSHLNFLPEHHTDFIFASLSEEFGLMGGLLVLLLYGVILWRGVRLAWLAPDRPTIILVSGLTLSILFQALVNMAMNIGLSPVTGVPLPLVSYGGSSLLTTIASLAVLESVALSNAPKP
jgi:rod shape determining protein RodA